MKARWLLGFAVLPLLAGCINDSASWRIDGNDHVLTLIRQQRWFWDSRVDLFVIAGRLPDCQRRHALTPAPASQASVEVFPIGDNDFILRQGGRLYQVETRTCLGFAPLDAEPAAGMGARAGVFREQDGRLRFVAEPSAAAR